MSTEILRLEHEPAAASGTLSYAAFREVEEGGLREWLQLRFRDGTVSALRYRDLVETGYYPHWPGHEPSIVMLYLYPPRAITLAGRNLKPVLRSILRYRCDWIAEATGEIADGGEPVIEHIHRMRIGQGNNQ